MSDTSPSSDHDARTTGTTAPTARTGRRRTAALIVGGALLFAGGAGTGAVVGTALSPASAATGQGFGGQGGPGGGMQPPSGTAPSTAPSTGTGTAPSTAPTTGTS